MTKFYSNNKINPEDEYSMGMGSPGLGSLGGFQGGSTNMGLVRAEPNYHTNQINRVKSFT